MQIRLRAAGERRRDSLRRIRRRRSRAPSGLLATFEGDRSPTHTARRTGNSAHHTSPPHRTPVCGIPIQRTRPCSDLTQFAGLGTCLTHRPELSGNPHRPDGNDDRIRYSVCRSTSAYQITGASRWPPQQHGMTGKSEEQLSAAAAAARLWGIEPQLKNMRHL